MQVSFGVPIFGIVALLAACAAVAVAVGVIRKPSLFKWLLIPAGLIAVLLGGMFVVRPSNHQSIVPATEQAVNWSRHAVSSQSRVDRSAQIQAEHLNRLLEDQQAEIARQVDANNAEIERQRAAIERQVDSNLAAIERQRASVAGRTHQDDPVSVTVVQNVAWAKLLFIGVALLVMMAGAVGLFASRRWIARHKGVAVLLLAVGGGLSLLLFGGAALYLDRARTIAADFRSAELRQNELRAIDETMRRAALLKDDAAHPAPATQVVTVDEVAPADPDQPEEVVAAPAVAGDSAATDDLAEVAESRPVPVELPEWVREGQDHLNDLGHHPALLVSEQWATVEESESQLEEFAALALKRQLQVWRPELREWTPEDGFLHQSGAIQKRFVEETALRFGEFEEPMYRSYWQVSVTPHVGNLAFDQWKASTVDQRLVWLGGGAGGLTALFMLMAGMLRIDSKTGGRYRGRLAVAALGTVATIGVAALMLA